MQDQSDSQNPSSSPKFKYVKKADLAPIRKIVQKQYEERLNKALLANRSRLERFIKNYDYDFVDKIHRKTYYWEHMGLTDEYDYATKNCKKFLVYERNGLIHGDNLILSLETDDMALDMKMVHKKIQDYLL
jgi:hypothetical protein